MFGLILRPELFLYLYMASCVSVLIFNIAYIFIDRFQQNKIHIKSQSMVSTIQQQIEHLKEGEEVSEAHLNWMSSKLRKLKYLKAFENSMSEVMETENKIYCGKYIKSLRIVFIRLISTYEKRDRIEKAYFASIIKIFNIDQGQESFDPLIEFLVHLSIDKDVYVRENALHAIFSMGNQEAVLAAWNQMEDNNVYHSIKLLSEGLLSYSGDKNELIISLLKQREKFSLSLVLPILQFIRFYSGEYQETFKTILNGNSVDKELRLEAIRYFRKYPYESIRLDIQKYVRYFDYVDWEYAAVAAQALSSYPGLDTIGCLKDGLKSGNWYIRLNCAEALIIGLKIPQVDLYDVYNGRDRYAREILQYVTHRLDIKKQKMEFTHGII